MKSVFLFIFLSTFLFCFSAQAKFHDVAQVTCDQEEVAVNEASPRLYLDFEKSIIGIGVTQADDCRVVDFYSMLVTAQSVDNETEYYSLQVASEIGRRNSCSTGLSANEGPDFKTAEFNGNELILHNTENCKELVFKIK